MNRLLFIIVLIERLMVTLKVICQKRFVLSNCPFNIILILDHGIIMFGLVVGDYVGNSSYGLISR